MIWAQKLCERLNQRSDLSTKDLHLSFHALDKGTKKTRIKRHLAIFLNISWKTSHLGLATDIAYFANTIKYRLDRGTVPKIQCNFWPLIELKLILAFSFPGDIPIFILGSIQDNFNIKFTIAWEYGKTVSSFVCIKCTFNIHTESKLDSYPNHQTHTKNTRWMGKWAWYVCTLKFVKSLKASLRFKNKQKTASFR